MTPKKLFFALLGSIGLTIVATVLIFSYARNRFDQATQSIAVKQAEIEIADREYQQLLQLQGQLEDFDVDLNPLLPNSKGQSEALELLFDVFRDANLGINGFNFTPTEGLPGETSQSQPSVAGNVLSLPLQLSPAGEDIDYPDLMELLSGLEQSQRQLSINRLNITSTPINADDPLGERNTDMTVDLSVQYLKGGGDDA